MEIVILASGSKGNAISITSNKTKILVDVGISNRSLINKMIESNLNILEYKNVLITHEHQDHIKGLNTFAKNNPNMKYYLTKGTLNSLNIETKNLLKNIELINDNMMFEIDNLKISTFSLSHDASEPVGFVIEKENKKVVIATDTGYIDENYYSLIENADLYILEANHDPSLLMNSRRPYHLKQRILGSRGHLSNSEAAQLINKFIKDKETIWAVAHISEDCNTNYLIEKAIVDIVEDPTKLKLIYTSQQSTEKIKI